MNHFDVVDGDAWLDLDSIIPYPEKYRRLDEIADTHRDSGSADWASCPTDGYNQGGKAWCEKNWGTKWNTYSYGPGVFDWELDDERSAYTQLCFDTAWTPISRRVLVVLSRIYPKSTFELRYAESEHRGRIRVRGAREQCESEDGCSALQRGIPSLSDNPSTVSRFYRRRFVTKEGKWDLAVIR